MKCFLAHRRAKQHKRNVPAPTIDELSHYPDGDVTFCPHLRPVYQAEMERGNSIVYIHLNAGSKCAKVIYFAKALQAYDELDEAVKQGTYTDYHFPAERYYHCDECGWHMTGPLEDGQAVWYLANAKEIVAPEDMVPPRITLRPDGGWIREACFTNVVNPRVVATSEDVVFEDGWQQFTYSNDWQILPTVK